MSYEIGDRVVWVRAVPDSRMKDIVGVVLAVIPNPSNLAQFTMYDVQFDFGTFTLYGTQLSPAPPRAGACSGGR